MRDDEVQKRRKSILSKKRKKNRLKSHILCFNCTIRSVTFSLLVSGKIKNNNKKKKKIFEKEEKKKT